MRKLRFGLPKGNLNRPANKGNRGHTRELFRLAGYDIQGYEPGEEEDHPFIPGLEEQIEFFCMKPKQLTGLIEKGGLDIAIIGRDNVEEYFSKLWLNEKSLIRDNPGRLTTIDWLKSIVLEKQEKPCEEIANYLEKRKSWWECLNGYMINLLKPKNLLEPKYASICNGITFDIENPFNEIENLGYGRVDVCLGIKQELINWINKSVNPEENLRNYIYNRSDEQGNSPIRVASAYPTLTYKEILKYLPVDFISLSPNTRGEESEILESLLAKYQLSQEKPKDRVEILDLPSSTEMMYELGFGDLIVDCTASGESFRNKGIMKLGSPLLKDSTARIYVGNLCAEAAYPQNYIPDERFLDEHTTPYPQQVGIYAKRIKDYFASDPKARRILEIVERLKAASLEYGSLYRDSIYHPSNNQSNP